MLDSLKQREKDAFQRKQNAFQLYKEAKERASSLHDEMEAAWNERSSAADEMNRLYDEMQRNNEHYRSVWDEYGRIRDANNSRIDSLKWEADYEHKEMSRCFDLASSEYAYGDKAMAPIYSQEGRDHQARRNYLNDEISQLAREVKEAKQNAEWRAPKTDSSAFQRAKDVFQRAKSRHEAAQASFKAAKAERDRLKSEFESLHAEHTRLKEEFQQRLEQVKSERALAKQQTVDKVNMALIHEKGGSFYLGSIFGQDAKIRPRDDGKVDVYFGGLSGAGDGMGHGHAVIDNNGNVTYLRDAWQEHDDYLIDDARKRGTNTHNI